MFNDAKPYSCLALFFRFKVPSESYLTEHVIRLTVLLRLNKWDKGRFLTHNRLKHIVYVNSFKDDEVCDTESGIVKQS